LVLWIRAIKNELLYFANVISLTIACSSDDARQNYLSIEHAKYLNTLVNVSNIKHLTIENTTLKKIRSIPEPPKKVLEISESFHLCQKFQKKEKKIDRTFKGFCLLPD
jgi:hypothetical protein